MKTTLHLEEETAQALKQLAGVEGRSEAEVVREALALYIKTMQSRPLPRGLGGYRSGRSDVSTRAEEFLSKAARERK